jgi:flagellar biosynthesis/type III secretory pathway protein FliH
MVNNMCNLSEGVRDEGIEIGLERGLEIGRAEGREEKALLIKNLMETMNWSLQQAINALKIPEADRAYYANAINGK